MINITQGENKVFEIEVLDEDDRPFDLTLFTKFKVCLPLVGGTLITLTEVANTNGSVVAVLGNPLLGILQVTLNFADSATLLVGQGQAIGTVLDNAGNTDPRPKLTENILNVLASPC